jgi:hypothetical protein
MASPPEASYIDIDTSVPPTVSLLTNTNTIRPHQPPACPPQSGHRIHLRLMGIHLHKSQCHRFIPIDIQDTRYSLVVPVVPIEILLAARTSDSRHGDRMDGDNDTDIDSKMT